MGRRTETIIDGFHVEAYLNLKYRIVTKCFSNDRTEVY